VKAGLTGEVLTWARNRLLDQPSAVMSGLAPAVDASVAVWLDEAVRLGSAGRHPGLATMALASAALGGDTALFDLIWDSHHEIDRSRRALIGDIAASLAEFGTEERGLLTALEPALADMRDSLTAVARAYQFADA
jgi:hypothetical protein